jgi:intracellular multiplication protein IcmE
MSRLTSGLKKFDGIRMPTGKWMLCWVLVLIVAGAASAIFIFSAQDSTSEGSAAGIGITPKKEDLMAGGAGTEQYNKTVLDQSRREAQKAKDRGQSYAPTPVGNKSEILDIADAPPQTKSQKEQRQQNTQEIAALKQSIKVSMEGIMQGMALTPQTTMNFEKPELDREPSVTVRAKEPQSGSAGISKKRSKLPGSIHAGSILYAVNNLKLNSDGKNTVVSATVVSGPLKNYTALGTFENTNESMAINFSRLVSPEGQEYPVLAFGIDPSTTEANVQSDVDHHYLSRWGGFMAASFLQGFADATRLSGVSTGGFNSGYPGTPAGIVGYGFSTFPQYSLADKGIIAAGEAGRMAAQELKEGVKRPPTVTLDSGVAIGILIVKADGD